ncbi:MAG: hypothetical protein K0U61_00960 [Alphaproteobacteria bacterium]|nr:hypothetical protein [Alphaproteobacteria bacterium]
MKFMSTVLTLSAFLVGCATTNTTILPGQFSPAVYNGTENAVLSTVDSLEACKTVVEANNAPEVRETLNFKPDPFVASAALELREKVEASREGVFGGCAGEGELHLLTVDGWEGKATPRVYIER